MDTDLVFEFDSFGFILSARVVAHASSTQTAPDSVVAAQTPTGPQLPGFLAMNALSAPMAPPAIAALVKAASAQYGISPALIQAVIANESSYNPYAISPTGAEGLMQLEPGTAAQMGVTNAFDPAQNVAGGTKYLRQLLDHYQGNTMLAVAAYNAGPGAVDAAGGVPAFSETQSYVQRVLGSYEAYGGQ
jgi:soluble lytic murein transglycosylase-like protein